MKNINDPIPNPEELLRQTLAIRCANNPLYSLRAFAKASGISHTVLSLVLSGKRNLSKKAIEKLADHLELSPEQRTMLQKRHKSIAPEDFQEMSLDTFEVISDWYHYAILSLLDLPMALFEAQWISTQLGITKAEAKAAMERLKRLELVEEDEKGRWRQSGKPIKIDNKISTTATKKFHKQLLDRASQSIDTDPIALRDFSSLTFTMDPSQVEYARKRLRDFRRQLMAELESQGQPSSVYNMTIQLYPVTPVQDTSDTTRDPK